MATDSKTADHADQPIMTCVEMTDLEQLHAAPPVEFVYLKQTLASSWVIRPLYDKIAAPYRWSRHWWSEADWRRRLTNANVRYATIHLRNNPAGLAEFERQPDHQVEITMFGLLPEYVGHGFGGFAVTLITKSAWHLSDARGEDLHRVWLQTSELDHPKMLPSFLNHGYRITDNTPHEPNVGSRA